MASPSAQAGAGIQRIERLNYGIGAIVVAAALLTQPRPISLGIAVGVETMCRLGLVTPKLVHKAGFHPTAVFGAMAAAAGVGAALRLEVECLECELADLGPVWATAACPAHIEASAVKTV